MLCTMVVGSAVVIFAGSRSESARPAAPLPEPSHERPWLTPEAAHEISGDDGMPGPLFDGLELGGPEPSPADRARIAAFARAHDVDIQLDVAGGSLASVRFAVTYGGCCGYEGADVLAMRFGRPQTQTCCGCDESWIDDWAKVSDDRRVHLRGHVRVNRVEVQWTPALTLPQLLVRADALIDSEGTSGVIEMPYPFVRYPWLSQDLGVRAVADGGRIREVVVVLRDESDSMDVVTAALRARWGRPRVHRDDTRTWRTADRIITLGAGELPTTLTIQKR